MIKVIGNRGIVEVILIFLAVMLAGVAIAMAAIYTGSTSVIYNTFSAPAFVAFSYFLDATIVLILALLLLKRHTHHSNTFLFEALEVAVTAFTSFFAFLMVFTILVPHSVGSGAVYAYAAVIAVALILLKERYQRLRDLTTVVSSIGVGLVLGLNFPFEYAVLLLGAVAVYDYVAVFKTSEMVKLAGAVSSNNLSFLISVSDLEGVPKWGLSEREIAEYMKCLKDDNLLNSARCKRILKRGELPVISQISLGEGDLCLPLMAAISAYASFSHLMAAVVVLGSLMGIIATMVILKIYKHPIPAIPPLFGFIGLSTGIALIATGGGAPCALCYVGALLVLACALVMLIDIVTIARRMHRSRMKNAGKERKR
jgi:presenilin-like A22 family membrane protease